MDTPIYDFLKEYAAAEPLRAHMPGHKGRVHRAEELSVAYSYDLTEISGADSLFEAEGIIRKSEINAASLYNTAETVYSCGGSTLCIQAMLFLMKQENRLVLAGRTVHRAFLNACILLGLQVVWVYPKTENGILSGKYDPCDFERALRSVNGKPCCIYITSPDYMGNMADIAALSEVSRRFDAPLLVDNAHGAHLAFFEKSLHPIALGADLCCDSAHKMLPCLTGCAYLHTSNERYKGRLKAAMGLFGSTSPSYLMLLSLDLCNVFLAEKAAENIAKIRELAEKMKERLGDKYIFTGGEEPFHVVIDAASMGIDDRQLGAQLEKMNCFPEYVGREAVVLLLSAAEREEDMERLEEILRKCDAPVCGEKGIKPPAFPKPKAVMGIREAALSESEVIAADKAAGRICAGVKVPCPPAVPIVISGEMIDENAVETMLYYGVSEVEVVI